MVLESLLTGQKQSQLNTTLESLLSAKLLPVAVRNYLVSCQVEGKSPRTIEAYSMVLSRFSREHDPEKASASDIRLFLLSLQDKKPATQHIYYRSLKTFYNWLVRERVVRKSPMDNIHPPKVPSPVIQPFTHQDIGNLLSLCSGHAFLDLRNRAMFLLFLDTGLRLEEMSRIILNDLDFNSETIRVMGKGNKGRMVRMGKTTQKTLLRYLLERKDDYPQLWVTEERRPMTIRGIKTTVRRYCKMAVTSGARPSPHTFRHTAAINYLRNGGDQFTLQIMLGHSTLEMTRRYVSSLGVEDMLRVHVKASPVDNLGLK